MAIVPVLVAEVRADRAVGPGGGLAKLCVADFWQRAGWPGTRIVGGSPSVAALVWVLQRLISRACGSGDRPIPA